jgi:hypothetical protein
MADTTARDTVRANYLRNLALRPSAALDAWRQLNASEQFLVITQMTMFYDMTFARAFQLLAAKSVRPNVEITVTNAPRPNHTPQALKAGGFALQPGGAAIQYWVHPSGRQVWLIPPPRAVPPANLFPETLNPAIDPADILAQAKGLVQRYRMLEQKAGEIKGRRLSRNQSAKEYYDSRKFWWQDYSAWKKQAESLEDELSQGGLQQLPLGTRAQLQQRTDEARRLAQTRPEILLEPLEAIAPR